MKMRNYEYRKMQEQHVRVDHLRCCQFFMDFIDWHKKMYGTDPYYITDADFIDRLTAFVDELVDPANHKSTEIEIDWTWGKI